MLLAGLLFLTACTGAESAIGGSDPSETSRTLDEVDAAAISLPATLGDTTVLSPDWDLPPRELDGAFVGQRMGDEGWLEFYAVDGSGKVLWLAERPPTCTGFALARAEDGRPHAILTNLVATKNAIASPTATAFDLHTGEEVWGPVEVTGPYKGPGLVFAAAPEGFMGDTGKKVALNASTGEVIATEGEETARRIVGEFQGALISVDAASLTAERPQHDGSLETMWSISLEEHGWDFLEISNQARHLDLGESYIAIPSAEDTVAVLELDTGEIIENYARDAAFDKQSSTLVTLNGTEVSGVQANGAEWRTQVPEGATLRGIGAGVAYLRADGINVAIQLSDGSAAAPEFVAPQGMKGDTFLPVQSTEGGAAIVENGQDRYLIPQHATEGGYAVTP